MLQIINSLCVLLAVVLLIPTIVFAIEVFAAFGRRHSPDPGVAPGPIAVLVPAHDESSGLAATLATILPQMRPGDRCLVVADNCSDDTAAIARLAGAEVIERFDAARRGKGYALDFGLRAMADDRRPDFVVIVDADCRISANALTTLCALAGRTNRPIQGLYLMRAPPDAARSARIAEFAWLVKNQVRPSGMHRLGLPCHLTGSGMAFPWAMLEEIEIGTGHIVEDLKLGIDLARRGLPPRYCDGVLIESWFPQGDATTSTQRKRWEHGLLGVAVAEMPKLLLQSVIQRDLAQFALGVDLLIPPVALLGILLTSSVGVCFIAAVFAGGSLALGVSAFGFALFLVTLVVAWFFYGRAIVPFNTLVFAPIYALRKLPMYMTFVFNRQRNWVRTKRDVD